MNIALISQNHSPGLLIFRRDFIQYLVNQGHTVYAFALDYSPEAKAAVVALGAIPVDYTLSKTGVNPFRDLKDTLALVKILKAVQPDVIFSFFVKPSIYGTLAAKLACVPKRIAMLEGLGYIHTKSKSGFSPKKRLLQFVHGCLCTIAYAFANKVLFLNSDDPNDLAKKSLVDRKKFQVLGPIGLDLDAYPYKPITTFEPMRFIFIGRLLAEKGIFEYLEAARLVKKNYPNAEFVVLGGLDPDNPAALTSAQLDEVIEEGIITYSGHVSNVSEWIASAHVFVLPSYREGYPRSTQEVMAIGRAVITTDVPGCRETVIDGANGFIIPPFDSSSLAEKMLYLIEHPEEIQRMGDESYRIATEHFDVHKINPILADILTR
ncbi:glycosyltransferase family 4 protein [Vibrio vulnificus]|uniref:glycosyltransferase family 4 protein n=1 Tax=Vibrio vulnificus TaxID=672 RepID=UPI000D3E2104|nr:glycosyltransferase family 4 protein [Vibrio vulnificus]PUZ81412.1 glycosyltransferase family 1 protein [Vibrio vulnificus]HAS6416303.1 glycosyltransferase [Vibrio vulnificus]HAS8537741.1 glycosyltransferase family 1 protein [Vibrio vulnificus]HDY7491594.1 glycosyltransferase family 4 protein [Vibrio vulnificus]HDY8002266.1 glycosyltransferase family 4 protein [Vibrio vulnificus]